MTINYNSITDTQKLDVADILSKIEAIEAALAGVQTARATQEVEYAAKEQQLRAEKNILLENVRKIRTATLT